MTLRLFFFILALSFSSLTFGAGELALMPGQVIAGHVKLEADCKQCHVRFNKKAQSGLCADCHKDVKADIKNHKGFHGRLKEPKCNTCHTDHKGRNANIIILDKAKFDHNKTDFPLLGAHQNKVKVKCSDCHKGKKTYREAPSACNDCHHKDDKHKGSLGPDCKSCHNERSWKEAKFAHSVKQTHFALNGKHIDVKCSKCHTKPNYFKDAPLKCVGCHIKVDKHKGKYGRKCETCHVERDWKVILFDHDAKTKFKLLGKHKTVKCISCHTTPLFSKLKTPTACIGCHRKDDVHKGGLGIKCQTCHNEVRWKSAKFDHDKNTKFPLLGKHKKVKCAACHTPALKAKGVKLPMDCIGCHRKDDKHKTNFGAKCETCHKETTWKRIIFNHNRDTKYALKGKHRSVRCVSCHTGKLYQQKLPQDCVSCHLKKDVHKASLGKRCESCHNEKNWKDARFDHGRARFPLLGLHIKVACKKCHLTAVFRNTPSDCFTCHKKDDAKVHKLRLGKNCAACHNSRSWKVWDFDHNMRTSFKLDGAHQKITCYACHKLPMKGQVIVAKTCDDCHDSEDVHRGDFGLQCGRCHLTTKWRTLRPGISAQRR